MSTPSKPLPFTAAQIREIAKIYPTPFHIYDERGIRENARRLNAAFAWSPGFREYFAVKALPNPHILKICKEEGFGGDCSSLAELALCERVGVTGENIMFTSNETPAKEYARAKELGAVLNLDDISHITSSARLEQSPPKPSSLQILRMCGLGVALTAKNSWKPGAQEKARFRRRAFSRMPRSS